MFHPKYGKRTVKQADVNVAMLEGVGWCENEMLSFTPWPKPCHERPFKEVGWWIGRMSRNNNPIIRWRISEEKYKFDEHEDKDYTNRWNEINWIKFLGTEL